MERVEPPPLPASPSRPSRVSTPIGTQWWRACDLGAHRGQGAAGAVFRAARGGARRGRVCAADRGSRDPQSAIRPLCIVVGGDSDGRRACPETYDFTEGGENRAAILNLYGWGITEEELTETGGDVTSIGALLVGRVARIELQQGAGETGGVVNTHAPGAIEPLAQ